MNDVRERGLTPQAEGSRAHPDGAEPGSSQTSDQRTAPRPAPPSNQEPGSELPFAYSIAPPEPGLVGLSNAFEGMRDELELANEELNCVAARYDGVQRHLKQLRLWLHQFVYLKTDAARQALLKDAAEFDRELAAAVTERRSLQTLDTGPLEPESSI